jgi:hypothetical protein
MLKSITEFELEILKCMTVELNKIRKNRACSYDKTPEHKLKKANMTGSDETLQHSKIQ